MTGGASPAFDRWLRERAKARDQVLKAAARLEKLGLVKANLAQASDPARASIEVWAVEERSAVVWWSERLAKLDREKP